MGALHAEAMAWLRYGKKLPIVCTEVGRWNADVLGMNRTTCVEVEVKVSLADLRAEFRNKTKKHWVYSHAEGTNYGDVPNYFYFCLAEGLGDKAEALIEAEAPTAGIVVHAPGQIAGRCLTLVRKAKRLKATPPSAAEIRTALLRMGSQLCGLNVYQAELEQKLMTAMTVAGRAALDAAEQLGTTPDIDISLDGVSL